jgi:hypothetical protein
VSEIDDYIQANRERFSREALDEKLRASGHDEAAIEAAWARVTAGQGSGDGSTEAPTIGPGTRLAALLLILVAVAGYGYIGFFGIAGISFSSSHGPDGTSGLDGPYQVVLAAYVVAMVVGLGVSMRSLWRAPRIRGTGAAIVGAIGLSLLLLIGINGACFVATSAVNGIN